MKPLMDLGFKTGWGLYLQLNYPKHNLVFFTVTIFYSHITGIFSTTYKDTFTLTKSQPQKSVTMAVLPFAPRVARKQLDTILFFAASPRSQGKSSHSQ